MGENIGSFFSHGKILISGEYLVLKGAKVLAIPVNLGQSLTVTSAKPGHINWETFERGQLTFTAQFQLPGLAVLETSHDEKAQYISKLLMAVQKLDAAFLNSNEGYAIKTHIEFDTRWGLGSSSSLINNIAQWAQVNAFELNQRVSQGSGYDIACAQSETPILYQIKNNLPIIEKAPLLPFFFPELMLVHLNKKMATEANISGFLSKPMDLEPAIKSINILTEKMLCCTQLSKFQELMETHEKIVGKVIGRTPVKETLFAGFDGAVKSLGAWGGDFVLAASARPFEVQKSYFEQKGFPTVLKLGQLLIS